MQSDNLLGGQIFFRVFLSLIGLSFSAIALAEHQHARHGFVLIGDTEPHLYHLARFNSPHRWQGLFEIELSDSAGKPMNLSQLRAQFPNGTVISLASSTHFDLRELGDNGKPFSFEGEFYEGYLRSPDKKLIQSGVTVTRIRTRYFQEILTGDAKNEHPEFVLACDGSRFVGAHIVAGVPSFEELISFETLFIGSVGNFPCTPYHQGSIVTIENRPSDSPLENPFDLLANSPVLGFAAYLSNVKRIVLDEAAVNPSSN